MQPGTKYFYRRAEEELTMAEKATLPEAAKAHYDLANLHLARCHDWANTEPAEEHASSQATLTQDATHPDRTNYRA